MRKDIYSRAIAFEYNVVFEYCIIIFFGMPVNITNGATVC